QFQIYGSPFIKNANFSFTPKPNHGAKDAMHNGKKCFGEDLTLYEKAPGLELKWLINAYKNTTDKEQFINNFYNKLAGNCSLQNQIKYGTTEEEIKKSWASDLSKFKEKRDKYLIYKE